jgi:hypothetical protein
MIAKYYNFQLSNNYLKRNYISANHTTNKNYLKALF